MPDARDGETAPNASAPPHPDRAAWEQLRRDAERLILRQLHGEPPDVIQDLVQEVLVKLLRQTRLESVREPAGLLWSIVRCTAIDHIRRKRRWSLIVTAQPEEGWDPADSAGTPPDSVEDPVDRVVSAAVAFFHENDAGCLELAGHFLRDREWSEVAGLLGRQPAAIRKQWSRCLDRLRRAVHTLPEFSPLRELFAAP